jgi:hypothetical protein
MDGRMSNAKRCAAIKQSAARSNKTLFGKKNKFLELPSCQHGNCPYFFLYIIKCIHKTQDKTGRHKRRHYANCVVLKSSTFDTSAQRWAFLLFVYCRMGQT